MLHSAAHLNDLTAMALDGDAGKIQDVYFDDENWAIRHIVVKTGRWLTRSGVLIPPSAVTEIAWNKGVAHLSLTRRQIEQSPDVHADKPVSRQQEARIYAHYGYPFYWMGTDHRDYSTWTNPSEDAAWEDPMTHETIQPLPQEDRDWHLRSAAEMAGYHILVTDGEFGHVEDVLFDDSDWTIHAVEVGTSKWRLGKHVLIPAELIRDVNSRGRKVCVHMSRADLEHSPEFDPASMGTARTPFGQSIASEGREVGPD